MSPRIIAVSGNSKLSFVLIESKYMLVLIIRTIQLYINNQKKKKATMNVYIQNIEIHFVIKTEM